MILTPKNCLNLTPDEEYPNIIDGLKDALLRITEIKGVTVIGQTRRTVTSKIFNRIHSFIKTTKDDYMLDMNDIITYLDNVNYVNKTALPIIYKAITGEELPDIVLESHLLNKFVTDGFRSLYDEEKPFFKKNYYASGFFLRKPSFTGSSVVSITDMKMYHKIENFNTDFEKLLTYVEGKGDIIDIGDEYFMSKKSLNAEKYIIDNTEISIPPIINNKNKIFIDSSFSEEQNEAVKNILTSTEKINCLTGAAGVGKTRVISNIVDNAAANGKQIVCCAFTGKASSRMEQSEVDVDKLVFPPKTIHSLMGTLKAANHTSLDLVIIDEASTMNSQLFSDFITVLNTSSTLDKIKFIFVGDSNQLPPIGGGQIFEDILTLKIYPIYRLTKNFRTQSETMKALFSDVLKSKVNLNINNHRKHFSIYNIDTVGTFINETINLLFSKDKYWYKDNKCTILTHTNKYVDYINYLCFKRINNKTIDFYEYTFDESPNNEDIDWEPLPVIWEGAKIVFTKNDVIDIEENNGAIRVTNGTVADVIGFMDTYAIVRDYDSGHQFYIHRDYDTVKLAYAMTVFKSQGSESQYIIYIHSNHIFETKRLAYTAMTRAQSNVKIYTPMDGFKMSLDVSRYTYINSK